jgi:prevent-host-death family protein
MFMQTFNIHEAKTQLSRLVEQAAKGESFVIAKAGKPMVKVMALNAPESVSDETDRLPGRPGHCAGSQGIQFAGPRRNRGDVWR